MYFYKSTFALQEALIWRTKIMIKKAFEAGIAQYVIKADFVNRLLIIDTSFTSKYL